MKDFSLIGHDAARAAQNRPAAEPDALRRSVVSGAAKLAASPRMATQRQAMAKMTADAPAQRVALEEDDEHAPLQAKADDSRGGLPAQLREGMEALSGMDLSDVRVHRNSSQPAQLNALAYAQGNDIHLGPGQEQHLPHEAWHVVQQRQGRVQPTIAIGGVDVNDDATLEREADSMGGRAASHVPRSLP